MKKVLFLTLIFSLTNPYSIRSNFRKPRRVDNQIVIHKNHRSKQNHLCRHISLLSRECAYRNRLVDQDKFQFRKNRRTACIPYFCHMLVDQGQQVLSKYTEEED